MNIILCMSVYNKIVYNIIYYRCIQQGEIKKKKNSENLIVSKTRSMY